MLPQRSLNPESCLIHAGHCLLTNFLMRAEFLFFRISFKKRYVCPWPGSSGSWSTVPVHQGCRVLWKNNSIDVGLSVRPSLSLSLKSINNFEKFIFNPIWMQKAPVCKDVRGVERPGEGVRCRKWQWIGLLEGNRKQTDCRPGSYNKTVLSPAFGPPALSCAGSGHLSELYCDIVMLICYNYIIIKHDVFQ